MQRVSRISHVYSKLKQAEQGFARLKTPFFILFEDDQEAHLKMLEDCAKDRFDIFYVYKTNLLKRICEMTAEHGFGAEVVNLSEMKRAVKIHHKVLLNGIHKTDEELKFAIGNPKVRIIVDSLDEIQRIKALSGGKRVPVGIRLSVPGEWHRYGIHENDIRKALLDQGIIAEGIHVHNGHEKSFAMDKSNMLYLRRVLKRNREFFSGLQWIDIGGGFFPGGYSKFTGLHRVAARCGARFMSLPRPRDFEYADIPALLDRVYRFYQRYVLPVCSGKPRLCIEPGMLVSNPNVYFVTRVVAEKGGCIVVDGGTNNLPAIAGKKHMVINLSTHGDMMRLNGAVSGPLPKVSDIISGYYYGDKASKGDLIVVADVGAYTYSYAHFFVREVAPFYSLKSGRISRIS